MYHTSYLRSLHLPLLIREALLVLEVPVPRLPLLNDSLAHVLQSMLELEPPYLELEPLDFFLGTFISDTRRGNDLLVGERENPPSSGSTGPAAPSQVRKVR